MENETYTSKATILKISAVSRAAVKVKDNFYTVEYSEERSIPSDADLQKEQDIMFDSVNTVVDKQVEDIIETFLKK